MLDSLRNTMVEMDELSTASGLLRAALDRYLSACFDIRKDYNQENIVGSVPLGLTDRVTSELLLVTSYEAKIQQAKAAICVLRNYIPTITPINTLPTEILAHIFELVVCLHHPNTKGKQSHSQTTKPPEYPIYLSRVCSRWRQVAIGASALWSHIYFSSTQSLNQKFLAQTNIHIARGGQWPLNVHIIDPYYPDRPLSEAIPSLVRFLAPLATRIKFLDLELGLNDIGCGFNRSILSRCFSNCIPGTLTQLSIRNRGSYSFIKAAEDSYSPGTLFLDLPKQHLEDVWLSVTTLQLRGYYPYWTSKIYHGLVELRLSFFKAASISEQQLVEILKSSPRLRIFELGISITDPLPANSSIIPVPLNNLEILISRETRRNELGSFLRLLAPGTKPLRMSIVNPYDYGFQNAGFCLVRIQNFFSRSNVTHLHVASLNGYSQTLNLFRMVPSLRVLVLSEFKGGSMGEIDLDNNTSLDSLCIQCSSGLKLNELQRFVARYRVQTLLLWRCTFDDGEVLDPDRLDLYNFCPVVKCLPFKELDPFDQWD
ncbi:F-box-like domain-containing protein [Ceratobasidium theobromae]|uniref:F-box-like domain-containing protein n=1 Tax=Ceratobasidium theobromae TaxID=1582974 RepID=A0A5N5QTI0_9AGAM|nr:F-box-like domain-containing protein [Ceratobasidium theobromae]